ncbi:MAG: hypothetical protein KAJ95_03960, partial [Gammaproteobacteria bacterium]|nr:hypothetical protein [Gammaproteobacteria bacterium]
MDILSMDKRIQVNNTTPDKASHVNLLPKKYTFEYQHAAFYLKSLALLLILFFYSASTPFAAGSMQGAFIDAGDKQAANRIFVKDVSERVLLPTFEVFAMQSRHLSQTTKTFCNAGRTATRFDQLKSSWRTTKRAWAQTLPFRFGPAIENFLDLKIQFWPD